MIRYKLIKFFLIVLTVSVGISFLVHQSFIFHLSILLSLMILGLFPVYIIGNEVDTYVLKGETADNQLRATLNSRTLLGAYVGSGVGLALSFFISLQCGGNSCSESFIPLLIIIVPAFLFAIGILMGFWWNFRWGRPMVYILILVTLYLMGSLVYEVSG